MKKKHFIGQHIKVQQIVHCSILISSDSFNVEVTLKGSLSKSILSSQLVIKALPNFLGLMYKHGKQNVGKLNIPQQKELYSKH